MKEIDLINFSVLPFEAILVLGFTLLATFLILRLVKRYLFVLVTSELWELKINQAWPKLVVLTWLVIGLLSLVYMLNQSFFVTLVFLVVLLVIGGKYWRDIISGMVTKFENRISEGDVISSDSHTGVVTSLGYRAIQIRMKGGDMAIVSYRNLNDYTVRKFDRDLKSEMITLMVKIIPSVAVETAIKKLKVAALQTPYALLTQPINVEVVSLDETGSELRLLVHAQSVANGKLLELELMQYLRNSKLLVE